jgi:HPt (histidine-containing phosphotransfer) domain-containing protein
MLESRTPPATTDLNGSPVDLGVLRAQTGGNANLEREILGLYLRHCPEDLAALKVADAPEARRQIAHRMVGSARSVGARQVADRAASVERGNTAALPALETAVAAACRFIADYLAE